VGRPELVLGRDDVRSALQHLGRQERREVPELRHLVERAGQKFRGDRGADQEPQRVFIEGHLGRVAGDVDPRRIHPGLGLAQVQVGRGAHLGAPPDHLVGLQLRLEGRPGKLEVLAVGGKGEVHGGHLGRQRDLRARAGLLRGEVLLERRIAQVPDAAEEVELPGADARVDVVELRGLRLPAARQDAGDPLLGEGRAGVHRRQQLDALDAVQGLRPLDVQGRHAQVAVVGKRQADDLPQLVVGEELLPRDVGGGLTRPVRLPHGARPGGGNGRLGPRVGRRQGTSRRAQDDGAQQDNPHAVHIVNPLMDEFFLFR